MRVLFIIWLLVYAYSQPHLGAICAEACVDPHNLWQDGWIAGKITPYHGNGPVFRQMQRSLPGMDFP
jgi:hypothetical protein